jgi:hypothetical protein
MKKRKKKRFKTKKEQRMKSFYRLGLICRKMRNPVNHHLAMEEWVV